MNQTTFRFGVDYYPEHWPESRWPLDAALMAEAGFNVVRLAEFAWSKMEPEPGCYDFAWLDKAIDTLYAKGISVVLGTPTASPPPWIMQRHPDIFRVLESGLRQTYGNRRNYCPNSAAYRDYARQIVTAMASHYAGHPAVIAWQTDNEFGQGDRCCCPVCISAFQAWARKKYGTLDALNAAWGTVFWSQVYTDWSQIPAPLKTGDAPNPGLALDYYRFASESYTEFQKIQIDILRRLSPNTHITHNLMGLGFGQLDYHDLARDLDFVAWDNYPRMQWTLEHGLRPESIALSHDAMRGIRRQNFWVMEQQAGQGGWQIVSAAPRPGELRLWAYQSIAHGADSVVFFRWRTARHGTEQYWHGLLDHHVRPTRRYTEIKRMGAEIQHIGPQILGTTPVAETAILYSYEVRFAFQIQQNNPNFDYVGHIEDIYRALHRNQIGVDVIAPDADLSGYRLIIAPAMYLLSQQVADNLRAFVESGGTLVITPRSGVKDEFNVVVDMPLPGLLTPLCGVEVAEYDSLPRGASVALQFARAEANASGTPQQAVKWVDVLRPTPGSAAEIIATYAQDYYAGEAAITRHPFGAGSAITVGTFGDATLFEAITPWLLATAQVPRILNAPTGVEVTRRQRSTDGQRFTFVLNHTDAAQTVDLHGKDLITGKQHDGPTSIAARDLVILA